MDFMSAWGAMALGTIGFWCLVVVAFLVLTSLVENDFPGGATWAFLIFVILLQVFGHVPIFQFMTQHTGQFLGLLLAYILAGTVYMVFKWTSYVYQRRTDAQDSRYNDQKPPLVEDHKAELIMWMAYWPFSLWWTLLNDPFKRIFNFVYNRMAGFLQQISDRAFAKQ